jgi:hypothetical protein
MFDFGPFGGSDPFFPWMEAVGPILFFVVFAVIAVVIVRGIVRWFRNNAAPVLTVPARVVNCG